MSCRCPWAGGSWFSGITLAITAAAAAAQLPRIRPADSLTLASVTHEERGNVEVLVSIESVTRIQYVMDLYATIPDSANPDRPRQFRKSRVIRTVDDSLSHRMNVIYSVDDPQMFAGSTAFPSKAILAELKSSGTSRVIVGDAPARSLLSFVGAFAGARRCYRGKLTAVGRSMVSVIVNGVPVALPAIEARGHLTVGDASDDVDLFIFDNPSWPLILEWSSQGREFQLTEIEWPGRGVRDAGVSKSNMKREGARRTGVCRAEIHGIYFAFASAELMPPSESALRQVATLLAEHQSWVVTIEGHTDNIGTHASNLGLSKPRAAAMRSALVTRFHVAPERLSTARFGDMRPIESNATIEGRARNRRVELAHKC